MIDAASTLRVVDAIISGTHEAGTSHYELLRAFACDAVLARADAALLANGYRTHEFGDSVLIERSAVDQGSAMRRRRRRRDRRGDLIEA
jgi:S-adenosylmethionine:tRNA ribosyltransferase-isomerase